MISLIQHFEADFLWKVSLKILNSGLILKLSQMCTRHQQESYLDTILWTVLTDEVEILVKWFGIWSFGQLVLK